MALSYATLFSARVLGLYCVISAAFFFSVLFKAFDSYPTFYKVAVYMHDSRVSMLVLINCIICAAVLVGRISQLILFGHLRSNEVDALRDSFYVKVYGTVFQYATLLSSIGPGYIFAESLSFIGVLGNALISERIQLIGQLATLPSFFFVRLTAAVAAVWTLHFILATCSVVTLLLAPEQGTLPYAVAIANTSNLMSMWNTVAQFLCASYEYSLGHIWTSKNRVLAYWALFTRVIGLSISIFIVSLPYILGLPINPGIIFGGGVSILFQTSVIFQKVVSLYRMREATQNMDERYPTISAAEISQLADRTCIICREEFEVSENTENAPKKLGCGHVFHAQCLATWLERQQSCPTCRQTVFAPPARRETPQEPQTRAEARRNNQINVPSLNEFAERLRAVTEDVPQDFRQQQLAQRLFHNDLLNPRTASDTIPREPTPVQASTSAHEEPREAVRRATLNRYGANGTVGPADGPVLIPLFDPAAIPDYFDEHAPQLPHSLAPWVRP